jgi:hypothetical protein
MKKSAQSTEAGRILAELAKDQFGKTVEQLTYEELHELMQALKEPASQPVYQLARTFRSWRQRFVASQAQELNRFLDRVMGSEHIMDRTEFVSLAVDHLCGELGLGLGRDQQGLSLAHEIVRAAEATCSHTDDGTWCGRCELSKESV